MKCYEKAMLLMENINPNLEDVFILLLKAHDKHDYRATYAIATWYMHGKHVDIDLQKGTKYLKLAAKHNISNAQYDLAVSYEKGIEVKKNSKIAFELYLKAVLNGDAQSVYEIGRCYYYGIGTIKNIEIANIFLENAELKGIK